jgi:translation elongation factor P/translation initiation factor 5A
MQRLELLTGKASRQESTQTREDVLDIVGVKIPFEAPFYLFFFVDDMLNNEKESVSFIGYQMKSPGPAFWGRMSKNKNQPIHIKGSCTFRTHLLNTMVKQWKLNGFKYGSGSVKDRQIERIGYYIQDNDIKFDKLETLKTLASFHRGEITKLASSLINDENDKILRAFRAVEEKDPQALIRIFIGIDRKGSRVKNQITIEPKPDSDSESDLEYVDDEPEYEFKEERTPEKIKVETPNIINYQDYLRYKAYLSLEKGKISKNQFKILYPWEKTLELMDQVIYQDFGIQKEKKGKEFKVVYPRKYEKYIEKLSNAIQSYEKGLNRVDPDPFVKIIIHQVQDFFHQLETGKIKISPKEQCPEINDCLALDGSIDETIETCKIYYYPNKTKRGEDLA